MNKKSLSVFGLVMMNIIAIDSIRSLPMSAEYGFSIVFYYAAAALLFFIPTALVSAELATGWPEAGGVYLWAREAFGKKFGFMTIWMQWFYNLCWYPTIMSFIAATLAYCINPDLVNNKFYILPVVFIFFWGATIINFFGMKASSALSSLTAVIGVLIPMMFIIILGIVWMCLGKPINIQFSWHSFFPDLSSIDNMVLLTAVLYSLVGIEMSAVHVGEVTDPQKNYPIAIFWSAIIILSSLILSSLAVALVIPQKQLNIVSGLMQAFEVFFISFHMSWFMPVLALLIVLSSVGGVNAWILGPSKSLLIACQDECLPKKLGYKNKHGVPVTILVVQGCIFTLLCSVFLFMPTVTSGFWVLTNITSILALLVYVAMFASAVKLRYKYPEVKRTFIIPGGKIGLWTVCTIGSLSCIFTIGIGFLPPSQIAVGSLQTYERTMIIGVLSSSALPFIIYALHERSKKLTSTLAL
ncbi:MAG: amino acid permease [Verrucomicrobia bacterium]|nr:MAG: amino acid permease [Verrucomicrobiota bacterium]